ncbi:hypothetical protein [Nesterenkonia sandarakina]|uniref:hypothetical protein n=1 Tax=Nesterenkonia sandarakina TaxID=272918 RepID=UPI000D067FBE|nr:hypothetical protein [Nesterenkonia sandarakina]
MISDAQLKRFGALPHEERFHRGVMYDSLQVGGIWLLAMYSPIDTRFLSYMSSTGEVRDVSSDDVPLAYPTAVLFLRGGSRVAILKGHRSAPGPDDLHAFLERWMEPATPDSKWIVNQLLRTDQLRRIREAKAVTEVTVTAAADDDLLSEHHRDTNPLMSDIARTVRGEKFPHGAVTVGVKLDAKYSPDESEALRKTAEQELSRGTIRPEGGSVTLIGSDGREELMRIVRDHMTIKVAVAGRDPDQVSFTNLAEGMVSAVEEIESRVEAAGRLDVEPPAD